MALALGAAVYVIVLLLILILLLTAYQRKRNAAPKDGAHSRRRCEMDRRPNPRLAPAS